MEHKKMNAFSIIVYRGSELPEAYKPMIFSKWLRSLRYGNDYFKLIDSKSYFDVYHKYVEKLLAAPSCYVKLAVLSDDYDVCLGWLVGRGPTIDYIHIHRDYRRTGIGTALLPKDVAFISHITKQGASFWHNKLPKARLNPFI
jgi:GNAT superfamily N-acetyltransferase